MTERDRGAVAVLGSWDTKHAEMRYMRDRLAASGVGAILIDGSSIDSDDVGNESDITATDLRSADEATWRSLHDAGRAAKIDYMAALARDRVVELHAAGRITGIIGCGGLQNTTLVTTAMRSLPFGVPKVLATTIASGGRSFSSVIGSSDIVIVPALADFSGLNFVTRPTLDAACACMAGMLAIEGAAPRLARSTVGVTLLGVTSTGASAAIARLEAAGYEAIGFHATGAGGAVMEDFVRQGLIDGVLDMNLHEIASECFGGGFSYGAANRLVSLIDGGVPIVISTGGLDFVDFAKDDFRPGLTGRRYVLHNGSLAHVKLTLSEAREVGEIVGRRLASAREPIPIVVAGRGLRADANPGEAMWDPDIDEALVAAIVENAGGKAAVERVDLNLNTAEFGELIADRFVQLMADRESSRAVGT